MTSTDEKEQAPEVVADAPEQEVTEQAEEPSFNPNDSMQPVMEIDMAGDPATIAEETVQAHMLGIPIRRLNEKPSEEEAAKPTDPEAEAPAADEEKDEEPIHPLRRVLLGEDEEAPEAKPLNVTAPVREFFEKNGLGNADEVLAELPQTRKQNEELTAKLEKANADLSVIAKLSPEALSILQMDLDGKDWRKEVASRPSFDWKKDAKDIDPKALAKAYGDGEITDEEWEEYDDGDERTKKFVQSKLDLYAIKYNADKDAATGYAAKQAEAYQEKVKKYNASLEATEKSLYKEVPGSEAYADKIKPLLTPQGVLGMFFEDDGVTLKASAMLDAWLVSDRATVLGSKIKRAQREAKDVATKELLRRTPEKRSSVGKSQPGAPNKKEGFEAAERFVKQRFGMV